MIDPSVKSSGTTAPPNVGWLTSGVQVPVDTTPGGDWAEDIAAHVSRITAAQSERRFFNKRKPPKAKQSSSPGAERGAIAESPWSRSKTDLQQYRSCS